jgi:HK97 family phage prohead protease
LSVIRFDADASLITAEAGDAERPARIAGIAVPWDTVATVSDGQQVRFARGAFDTAQKPAKLIENHDLTQLRGVVNALQDTDEGLEFEATLADTRASRDAVALLKAGAYDSVSVGAQPTKFTTDAEGVMTVTEASLVELSLVAVPAFSEAVITKVAATEPTETVELEQEQEQDTDNTEQESEEMADAEKAEPVAAEATIPTNPIIFAQKPELPSAVEYLSAFLKGGADFDRMQTRLRAAAPDVVTNDVPGILPTPILGPVYNNFIGNRPVVDAIGARAMPGGGKVFIRPEVTTHTSMGVQTNQNENLTQGTLVVTDNQVTKNTYGGFVQLSEQAVDFTDPAILTVLLDDMARIYANQTDDVAADALASGITVTRNFEADDVLKPEVWAAWIAGAARTILSSANGNLPTHIFLNPESWGWLVQLSDDSKRPLFPQVGPMNAFGNLGVTEAVGNAFGLSVVVDRNFPADFMAIGDASGFEIYEQQKGAIQASNPAELSTTLAFRGYFATLMIDSSKFVKMALV